MTDSEGKISGRPKRMDGYIRVSRRMGREGPGYLSPKIQREAIQRWADYRHVEIVKWHTDEDQSGGTQQRPGMRDAMQRTLDGRTDGIACWRLNRFARNVSEALQDVKAIHGAGGALACVEEDIDPTGPFGEFILTVLLAVAALELNNAKAGWRTAKAAAMERGAVIGPTPYGYRRRKDGTLEVDPEAGPIVQELFRLAAQEGLSSALSYAVLNEGRVWTVPTVRRLLAKRSYLGEFAYGDLTYNDPELALVSPQRWEAAQLPAPPKRRTRANFPLSGLAQCGTCGTHMVGARGGRDRKTGEGLRTYRCAASLTTWRKEPCPAPATTVADRLEQFVREVAAVAADRTDDELVEVETSDEFAAVATEVEALEAQLEEALDDPYLRDRLGARYHKHIDRLVSRLEQAEAHYRASSGRQERASRRRSGMGDTIRNAQGDELAELLDGMLASIVVERGRGPIEGRVRFATHDLDVGVPPAP